MHIILQDRGMLLRQESPPETPTEMVIIGLGSSPKLGLNGGVS